MTDIPHYTPDQKREIQRTSMEIVSTPRCSSEEVINVLKDFLSPYGITVEITEKVHSCSAELRPLDSVPVGIRDIM